MADETATHAHDHAGTPSPAPATPTADGPSHSTADTDAVLAFARAVQNAAPSKYELLDLIGRGGMGDVYRARDLSLNRDVAVKILQERFPASSVSARRFLEEAQITGQLQHPGIPPIHQVGTLPDGRPFLAMKLIKGETLADILASRAASAAGSSDTRSLTRHGSPELLPVFEAICQAVGYAHEHGVIHRDLKPANVMVGAFGEVQVMDWGLAKLLASRAASTAGCDAADTTGAGTEIQSMRDADEATRAGSVLGTPAFMPPEQAIGAVDQIDARSDVFGLGGILAVILTGKPPFVGENAESTRQLAAKGKVQDCYARLDASGADPELVALCKRCLAPEKPDRPADAGEVATAVAQLRAAADERARQAELDRVRIEGEKAAAEVKTAEQRKRRKVQLLLAGAVVGLVAAAGFGVAIAALWRDAEGARDEAERQRGIADTGRIEEGRLRGIADNALGHALHLKGIAEQAKASEEEARKKLTVVEYGRTMQVAHHEWRENNLVATLALLDSTEPKLRGWEFRYVHRLCHSELLTLKGHTITVLSASFSADGTRIVTGSYDNTAKVWDARTGALLFTLRGHSTWVNSAAFNADGRWIVTASDDNTAKVWDAQSGDELLTLKGHTDDVNSASFSTDGTRIVTGSDDMTAKVWDARTGAELLTLKGHSGKVQSASFSADGIRIVTGSWDGTAKAWDARTRTELLTLKGHTGYVFSASFSADGLRIVTASTDKTAKVWDARFGAEQLTLKGHTGYLPSAAFSADGARIVTGSVDETAKVWDARTGAEVVTLQGHSDDVNSAAFSRDGALIVTGSDDRVAKVWDARTGAELISLKGHTGNVLSASFSVDGSRIVTAGSRDETAKVWDARTGAELLVLKGHTESVQFASFNADGTRIVTGSLDRTAKVWDARTGAELLTLKGHTSGVSSARFSADGTRIVTGSTDMTAKVWDSRPFRDSRPPDPPPVVAPPPRELNR